jgi:hypothetical protein
MPMMTIESVKKAQRLINERNRIAAAKWTQVAEPTPSGHQSFSAYRNTIAADEQLQWAIEEFRARKLAEIDAQLRELGVDPASQSAA